MLPRLVDLVVLVPSALANPEPIILTPGLDLSRPTLIVGEKVSH